MDFVNQTKNKIETEEREFKDFILKTHEDKILIKMSSDVYKTMIKKFPESVGI